MITVILPAYNEQDSIAQSVQRVRDVCDQARLYSADIIVVDDGSSDDTLNEALQAGALVVRHPHNLGYGRALKAGILRSRFDTIVIIDADLTYPIESLPILLQKYSEGFDMVVGARTGEYYIESVMKGNLRNVLKWLVEFTAGRKIPDINSGFRVFSRQTVIHHLDHLCDTFSFTTSLTLAYMMTGRFVNYVPIEYHQRQGATKVRLLRDSLRTMQYIAQSITFYNPIKMFVLLSMACLLAAAPCLLIGLLWNSIFFDIVGAAFLIMCGLIFAIGMVADLLRQVGLQLRPERSINEKREVFSAVPPQDAGAQSMDPSVSQTADITQSTYYHDSRHAYDESLYESTVI